MLTDFMNKEQTKEDLAAALRIIRSFKECESEDEFYGIMFASWEMLELLQEMLEHLVEGKPLSDDEGGGDE